MRSRYLAMLIVSLWFFSSPFSQAEDEAPKETSTSKADLNLTDLKLEDLMKVTIASDKPLTERESPGIISIITREEILNSGARDLVDVFRLVPGYQFAAEYYGTLGFGIRGLWSMEGKVLTMIDGVPINELYYNSILVGDRFPLDQIERIEIIRGPGSAIYGNAAEYGVINMITRTGEKLNGAEARVTYGRFSGATSRSNISLAYGKKFGDQPGDLDFSLKTYLGQSQMSDRNRVYADGSSLSMLDAYRTIPQHLNAAVKFKGFSVRAIVDKMNQSGQDVSTTAWVTPTAFLYDNYFVQAKYEVSLSPSLKFSPEYNWGKSYPYNFVPPSPLELIDGGTDLETKYDLSVTRNQVRLPFSFDPTEKLNLVFGVAKYWDYGLGRDISGFYLPETYDPTSQTNSINSKSIKYNNLSLFAQGIYSTPYGNFTGGGRLEQHSTFGTYVVPRFGYNLILDPWHIKLLASRAFRYPSVGNINDAAYGGNTLIPELTRVYEIETGYQFSPFTSITLNIFDTLVNHPIVYLGVSQSYGNFNQTGSQGFELNLKTSGNWGYSEMNYSFYSAAGIDQTTKFVVPQDSTQLVGFAPHNISWNSSLKLSNTIQINPQLIWLSKRYTFSGPVSEGTLTLAAMDPTLLGNLYLTVDDVLVPHLNLGVGMFDVFGSGFNYASPYDLGRGPQPGPSREGIVRLSYQVNL